MSFKVVDLSEWNGDEIYWDELIKDGIKGIIARVGYGHDEDDPTGIPNIDEALKRGMLVGAYWFLYALNIHEAIEEAENFDRRLQKYKGKLLLPVFADFEYDSETYANSEGVFFNKRSRTNIIKAFCVRLEELGWYVGNYANVDYIENRLYQDELERYDLWLAEWDSEEPSRECGIWQYTENGDKYGNGIDTCDMNIVYRNYPKIIKEKGLNGFKKEIKQTETDKKVDIDKLVQEVLQGKYGNDEVRKAKLGKLYDVVQDKVEIEVEKLRNKNKKDKIERLAREVLLEKHGDGEERKEKLGDLYDEVQDRVETLVVEVDRLARDVINGDYGNGEERREKLGSMWEVVQHRVDQIYYEEYDEEYDEE